MPTAPPSTKEQVGAALQTAGQYAGGSTVWTLENAEGLGLDPARGYVARGTPTDVPISSPTLPPVEKPPSMVPGLGTPGGAPVPEKVSAPLPAKAPPAKTAYPGAIPDDQQPKQDQQTKQKCYEGAIPDEQPKPEAKKETSAYPGAIPDEEVKQPQSTAQQPSQPGGVPAPQAQPLQPATPMPPGTGAGTPQGVSAQLVPGRDAHISALIASGKTPGE